MRGIASVPTEFVENSRLRRVSKCERPAGCRFAEGRVLTALRRREAAWSACRVLRATRVALQEPQGLIGGKYRHQREHLTLSERGA